MLIRTEHSRPRFLKLRFKVAIEGERLLSLFCEVGKELKIEN